MMKTGCGMFPRYIKIDYTKCWDVDLYVMRDLCIYPI